MSLGEEARELVLARGRRVPHSWSNAHATPPPNPPTQHTQWLSHRDKTKDGPSERAGFNDGIWNQKIIFKF